MGYLTTGFLFLAEPPFAAIADAFAGFAARGYRHKVRPVWVLDLWEKPWRKGATHFPFQERFAAIEAVVPPSGGPDGIAFLRELDALLSALGDEADLLVAKECRIALGVSRLANAPTFFFAGDDDLVDVACAADSGRLARISTSPPISERAERPTVASRFRAKLPTATMAATPTVTHATK